MQKKLYILISFSLALCAGAQTVKVADFGAIPNDGKCDKHAVRMAYQHAKQTKAKELVFDKGTYDFEIDDPTKEAALDLFEFENFCVRGEVNADGSPATLLLRHYKFASNMTGLQILRAIRCKNFSVKNLAFDNSPRYSSAGKVVEIAEDRVVIEVFKGNPAIDGCVFYCGNVWDLKTKYLKKGAPSLTYGDEIAADEDSYKMRVLPKKNKNALDRMELKSARVAGQLQVGDGVSWHFGYRGNMFTIRQGENIYVENVLIKNAIGFAASISLSKNIEVKKFETRAPDNQLMVSSRDGLILPDNTGKVVMDGLYIEGVRWDGQNSLGMFLWLDKKESDNTATFTSRRGVVFAKIYDGSKVGIFVAPDKEVMLTVQSTRIIKGEKGQIQEITFMEKLPENIDSTMPVCVYSWDMTEYTLKNSHFKNIAGAAALVRNSNALIENCIFDHIMYPAIMIGPAISEMEGPITKDMLVKNCRIISSGWEERHGARGAIAAKVQPRSGKIKALMRNIRILDNSIENSDIGIQIEDAIGVKIKGNKFINIKTPLIENNLENADISM